MSGSLDTNVALSPRVEPAQVLGRLRLTAGKAAEICGITRRQLCYWTDKGIIPCCGGADRGASRRIYDFTGLSKALMLKRLMDEGRGLRRAVRELRLHWIEIPEPQEDDAAISDEHALLDQAERLAQLGDRAREIAARAQQREALVSLAVALTPLCRLSEASSEGRISIANGNRTRELAGLLSNAERTLGRAA